MTIILTIQALKEYHNYRNNGFDNENNNSNNGFDNENNNSATKSICVSQYC